MMDNQSIVTSPFGVQKIGKGKSPLLPKEKDANVNLRDRLNDLLASEKYIMDGYRIGSNEIIDQQLFDLIMQNLDNAKKMHRKMLGHLFDLGEYQADTATQAQIADTFDVFTNYKVQLPYPQS